MESLDGELLSLVEAPRQHKRKHESEKDVVDGLKLHKEGQVYELEHEMILAERAEKNQNGLNRRTLSIVVCDGAASLLPHNIHRSTPTIFGRVLTPESSRDGYKYPFSAPTPKPAADVATPSLEVPFSAPTPRPFQEAASFFCAPTSEPFKASTPLFACSLALQTDLEATLFNLEHCQLSRRLVL
ncbi:hypothetical protein BDP27DRAFT_1427347 [Rhodocollybia butyracea]|uniref:Uncharacterized protein n=1 Tax=Rhodocollybia butyracea TaxID=206335 RepID=A0A9P5U1Y8_9AGAR|nr:hypothetical protein BDP27DRAFT_1427347 [Rhodocollybia butyracea]